MSEACFYTGSNYNGDKECIKPGEYSNIKYDDRYSSAKIPPNFIAVLYEHPNFDGETLRLDKDTSSFPRMDDKTSSIKLLPDCHNPKFIWEPECNYNRNLFTQLDTKRSDFCNANRTNALSQKCMTWCNENKDKCSVLNRDIACNIYNIPQIQCTDEKIFNIEKQCIKYGLIDAESKTTTSQSIYQCNDKGIASLQEQCKKFKLDEESKCTALGLSDALMYDVFDKTTSKLVDTLEHQSKLGTEQREKASVKLNEFLTSSVEQSTSTLATLADIQKQESSKQLDRAYSLLENISVTNKPKPPNYTQTYIIVALISLILIILSVLIFIIF
jgi:hypothetical protein